MKTREGVLNVYERVLNAHDLSKQPFKTAIGVMEAIELRHFSSSGKVQPFEEKKRSGSLVAGAEASTRVLGTTNLKGNVGESEDERTRDTGFPSSRTTQEKRNGHHNGHD